MQQSAVDVRRHWQVGSNVPGGARLGAQGTPAACKVSHYPPSADPPSCQDDISHPDEGACQRRVRLCTVPLFRWRGRRCCLVGRKVIGIF